MEDNSNSNTNQPLLQYLTQELTCSVCMSTFKHPVTIECGHSFCRYCLLNYIRTKNMCPICRTVLHHVTEHPPQDVVLADLVNYLKIRQNAQTSMNLPETNNEKIGTGSQKQIKLEHIQNLLLVDIRCRDILLPYTKVMATFELQSPTLLAKLDRFVARQQNPFNRLGIVSKITYINQLRYNVYECVIQGKAFCEIKNEEIQKKQDQNQQYFYRTCQAEIIYQDYQLNQQIYQNFLHKFIKIKDKAILKDLSKWIDLQQIFSKNNPTATFYSIIRILAETNQNKYKAVTSFNSKTREDFITQFLAKVPSDFQKMPYTFICVKSESGISREGFFVGLLVFVIVFLLAFNTDYSQI